VVVEAAAKSGSLITARNALDQGRDVAVVPGHPLDARASGCKILIRDGACLIRNAADVIDLIEEGRKPLLDQIGEPRLVPSDLSSPTRPVQSTAQLHMQILSQLGPSPMAEDQLIRDLGQSAQHIAPALIELELEGKIARQPGGLLSLVPDQR
jgi:DNA processing protein